MLPSPARTTKGAVSLRGISKTYGGIKALTNIDLDLAAGQVHALIGQNGAGKSTCLGIIAGRISATSGTVTVRGVAWPNSMTPASARNAGVSTIYQELTVVPTISALDNVFLGNMTTRFGMVAERSLRRRYGALCDRLGVAIDPDARAGDLSLADQQMLEIMRALSGECNVLLLDEPTAALSQRERVALFSAMRDLKGQGVTLIFVSHYLDEVEANSDTVTVFRDGRLIESGPVSKWTRERMVTTMLGAELEGLEHRLAESSIGRVRAARKELLRVENLSSRDGVCDINLEVRAGEIVGIGGLVGSGRTSLLKALGGASKRTSGKMWLDGHAVALPRTPYEARRLGISVVPEDRKADGLFLAMSSRENIMLGNLKSYSRAGFVQKSRFTRRSDELANEYDVSRKFLERSAGELSGGNQQKLLLARAANGPTRVLLADEATRGIDIGAKSVILQTLRRLADTGLGIVFVSSELEEVAAISDRVYVLKAGRLAGYLDGSKPITEVAIIAAAFETEVVRHV
ncbi:sugar ABC transporter ATP-binding protein [Bradyrhizobium sp. Arg314]